MKQATSQYCTLSADDVLKWQYGNINVSRDVLPHDGDETETFKCQDCTQNVSNLRRSKLRLRPWF